MSNDELQKAIDDITSGEAAMDAGLGGSASVGGAASSGTSTTSTSTTSSTDDDILGVPPTPDTSSEMPTGLADIVNPAMEAAPSVSEESTGLEPLGGFGASDVAPNVAPVSGADAGRLETANSSEVPTDLDATMPAANELTAGTVPSSAPTELAESLTAPVASEPVMAETAPADAGDVEAAALRELYPLLPKMSVNPRQKFDICMKVIKKTGEEGAAAVALESAKEIVDEAERGECLLELVETFKG